jgi:hypothetical protein
LAVYRGEAGRVEYRLREKEARLAPMEKLQFLGAALVFLACGGLMVFYEVYRIRIGRRILAGNDAIQLYWVSYMAMFCMAITLLAAAVIR